MGSLIYLLSRLNFDSANAFYFDNFFSEKRSATFQLPLLNRCPPVAEHVLRFYHRPEPPGAIFIASITECYSKIKASN